MNFEWDDTKNEICFRDRGFDFAYAARAFFDRDRIVHATAFRRLTHKTQVFLYHEGDHYRTRLTHTIEVAQIARAIARMLRLDEDLAEALALAHDLGHPPFGHAGERALDAAMAQFGGFDHNAQSFKVVTRLERKYAAFDGLNLSLETLEGLVKHNGPLVGLAAHEARPGEHRILLSEIERSGLTDKLRLNLFASAEARAEGARGRRRRRRCLCQSRHRRCPPCGAAYHGRARRSSTRRALCGTCTCDWRRCRTTDL